MALQEDRLRTLGFSKLDVSFDSAVEIMRDRREGRNLPLKTKWTKYNSYINGGLEKGVIQVIAGRPGTGKSAFTNKMLFDVFDFNRATEVICLYFNYEMTSQMQVMREVSSLVRMKVSDLLSSVSPLEDTALRNITALRAQLSTYAIYFMDQARTVPEMDSIIAQVVDAHPLHHVIVVVDHTRLIKPTNEQSELDRLNRLSGSSMYIAKNYGVSYLFLSQLNRNIETPERAASKYVPQLSDLFGADSLGQTAHIVSIIQRPEMYQLTTYINDEPAANLLALHIVKNRNGSVLWIPFEHNLSINHIVERA